jgi:hypothetical protein
MRIEREREELCGVCVLSVKGEKSRATKREELCCVCFERQGREESGLIPSV